jgi:hypothetical protein
MRRNGILIAVLAATALALVPGAAGAATGDQSQTRCPGTFTVLHNDRIGQLQLPAGRYEITVRTPGTLACADASKLFADFLRRPNGDLPNGWRLNVGQARFSNRGTNQAFSVRKARGGGGGSGGTGGGGGGGGGGGSGRTTCPTFQVLHNDRIGSLRIPAGNYVITVKRMSCPAASKQFARFLQSPGGRLPDGWQLKPRKAKFRNPGTGESFRIKRA